jgi:hypothetical protein
MISAKITNTVTRQVIITSHNSTLHSWTRTTNGGRGESNAWSNYPEVSLRGADFSEFLLGEAIVIPLTEVDTTAIENNELPNVLIQKLTKQYRNRTNELDTTKTMRSECDHFISLLDSNPNNLGAYHKDGRSNKATTKTTEKTIVPIKVTNPIIKIVHDNYKENSLSF